MKRASYRPRVERLEPRLPPGDALRGVWFASSLTTPREMGLECAATETGDEAREFENTAHAVIISPLRRRPALHRTEIEKVELAAADESASAVSLAASVQPRSQRVDARSASHTPEPILSPAASMAGTASAIGRSSLTSRSVTIRNPILAIASDQARPSKISSDFSALPLVFEANHGQTDSRVDFIARTGDATVFLTPTAAVFSIENSESSIQNSEGPAPLALGGRGVGGEGDTGFALHMQMVGANPAATPIGQARQPGIVNYFIGNNPNQWHANIATFGGVKYQDVYPGIDLAYYGNDGQLEYDFIVSPDADPNQIALNFAGAEGVEIDSRGNLVVQTAAGDMVQQRPYIYQDINGMRQEVAGEFRIQNSESADDSSFPTNRVSFEIGTYDPSQPLVIDPLVLRYSTYLGAATGADYGYDIAADGVGNVYASGATTSTNFPTNPGAFDTTANGATDAFVAKLSADGSGLIYSTYLGGSESDYGWGVTVDAIGNAYVNGQTNSNNFPTTVGALSTSFGGGGYDAFLVKLNAAGNALAFASYIGGAGLDYGSEIAVDQFGSVYATGNTDSTDFAITPGAFDTTFNGGDNDAYLIKLNSSGSALIYGTYYGGSGIDYGLGMALDGFGNAYVSGITYSIDLSTTPGAFDTTHNGAPDTFAAKLSADGSTLLYGTFLGGSASDRHGEIAVDESGHAYVTGRTTSDDFPVTSGAFDTTNNGGFSDAYMLKLSIDGSSLIYSTFLGGVSIDRCDGIAIDSAGNAYVTGFTNSFDFPSTPGAFDTSYNGSDDVFMVGLNPDGSALLYATFLGGTLGDHGGGISMDRVGNIYVTGDTLSSNFPTTPGAFDTSHNGSNDAFLVKFCARCVAPVTPNPFTP